MKTYLKYFLILSSILIVSCTNDTKIIKVQIIGNSPSTNNKIELCLDREIGYGNYDLNFEIELNDGVEIIENTVIYGHTDNQKKCFDLFLAAKFIQKGDNHEYHDLISKIYKGNVKSMKIEVLSTGDLISTSTFYDL